MMSEKGAKLNRNIPPHVHCNVCKLPVAQEEAKQGSQLAAVPQGPQIAFVTAPVPVCPSCFAKIQEAEKQAQTRSRIIVPGSRAPV